MTSFVKIRPISTQISHDAKWVLMNGWTMDRQTDNARMVRWMTGQHDASIAK